MRKVPIAFVLCTLALVPARANEQDTRYAVTMNDGTVTVMQVVDGVTVEECIAKWSPERKAMVVSFTAIPFADVPRDRSLRNAWTFDKTAKKFGVDMPKAKALWKEKLLRARGLAANDADKSLSDAEAVADVKGRTDAAARRQSLNGIVDTRAIDAATTPAELKATLPPALAPYIDQ